jgi:hypothetical protein
MLTVPLIVAIFLKEVTTDNNIIIESSLILTARLVSLRLNLSGGLDYAG